MLIKAEPQELWRVVTRARAVESNLVRLNKKGKRSHRHQEGKPVSQAALGAKPRCILKGVGGAGKCAEIHLAYNQFSRTRLKWLRVDLTEDRVCLLLQLTTGLQTSRKKEGRRTRPYILSASSSLGGPRLLPAWEAPASSSWGRVFYISEHFCLSL